MRHPLITVISALTLSVTAYANTPVTGTIATTTWFASGSPYRVTGDILVPIGETLSIEPGVDVLFDVDVQFVVEGSLHAIGTEIDSIRFEPGTAVEWGGLRLSGGDTSTIAYARISGGHADGPAIPDSTGGGIYLSNARLGLANVVLMGNAALDDGGAMCVDSLSVVSLERCTITGNISGDDGGGIAVDLSTIFVAACTVNGNTSSDDGGGLSVYNHSVSVFVDTDVSDNVSGWDGGGIILDRYSDATLDTCNITNNSAADDGGGLEADRYSSVTLTGCVVENNYAADDAGGVHAEDNSISNLINCTISGNTSADDGGGLSVEYTSEATLTGCDLVNNVSGWDGGGLSLDVNSTAALDNCTVTGNSAADTGGGVEADTDSRMTLNDCNISGNVSSNDAGGVSVDTRSEIVLYNCEVIGNSSGANGGGISVRDTSAATLTDCIVTDNASYYDGGGLSNLNSDVTLVRTTFSANTSDDDGGAISSTGTLNSVPPSEKPAQNAKRTKSTGRLARVTQIGTHSASLTVEECEVTNNTSEDDGGAFYLEGAHVTVTDCNVSNNVSGYYSGAFEMNGASDATLTDCIINNNSALDDGGAFSIWNGSTASLTRCTVNGNVGYDGGAFWIDSPVTMTHCVIAYNEDLEESGGGLAVYDPALVTLQNCTIFGNTSWDGADTGGGVSVDSGATVVLNNTILRQSGPDDILNDGEFLATYSNIEQGSPWPGLGNVNVDPVFVDAVSGDFRLTLGSPAIDAGDPTSPVDLDGSTADMGAFAFSVVFGDASRDGSVSALDASQILQYVVGKRQDVDKYAADVTGNGDVTAWDASYVLTRVIAPETPFPVEEVLARPSSSEPRHIWWEANGSGMSLVVDHPIGVEAIELKITLNDDNPVVVSADGMVVYRQVGSTLDIALARSSDENQTMFTLQHPSTRMTEPSIQSASVNEGTIPVEISRPLSFALGQNVPNPFNPQTAIRFTIPAPTRVQLSVFNTHGQIVRNLIDTDMSLGSHSVMWDGRDATGRAVSSGVYVYRLTTGNETKARRMVLLR
jgi:predicted outer membrane repeat protein